MRLMNKDMTGAKDRPVKVVQFGEGNFLRGFFDYFLHVMNKKELYDGKAVVIQPGAGSDELENYLKENNIPYVNDCILMALGEH